MSPVPAKRRRRRGVILTPIGLNKLLAAKADIEMDENHGNRYTLEDLNERTGLAVDTLTKVFACESKVDKQSIKACFRAFNLDLESSDFFYPDDLEAATVPGEDSLIAEEPELPEGQVPLNSRFYIERPPAEADSFKTVLQPGALIRIKGARRAGKSSLMSRILDHAGRQGCQTVLLSFQLADRNIFRDFNRLLQWFCASVGLGLKRPNRLADYWDELFGSQISCKSYFEQYLLAESAAPVVLGLDDVDRLFEYPELAGDFFSLLRTWHEEGKNQEVWKRLRLVVVHSTDVYIPLDANKSPFNVGLPVNLEALTTDQILELAHRYDLDWSRSQAQKLTELVGGQPYLVKKGLYHIWHQDTTLEELVKVGPGAEGIYGSHLQWQMLHLERQPELSQAFEQVLRSEANSLSLSESLQLQRLGLIDWQDKYPVPSCRLYEEYFSQVKAEA
ncbi:serine/threonine protein kinase [filamentous cyanobacterium CCP5]|nr:serine/threonine protein kinase [filamentous cyanobacterium CCP5]